MIQAEIIDFFKKYYQICINYDKLIMRCDCKFINDIAETFPDKLTIYTQILTSNIEWNHTVNHTYALDGLAEYFEENYTSFVILKNVLISNKFIQEEHRDYLNTFTKDDKAVRLIYTYLINKQLFSIYVNWKNKPMYCNDAFAIHNKILEIHNTHNIPFDFPDIKEIVNTQSLLEPTPSWCMLLLRPVVVDDFLAYLKIWRYLKDYLVIMTGLNSNNVRINI